MRHSLCGSPSAVRAGTRARTSSRNTTGSESRSRSTSREPPGRPRQPKRMRPMSSTPNITQAMQDSIVLCTRCWVRRLVTNTKPVISANVRIRSPCRSAGTSPSREHRAAAGPWTDAQTRRVRSRRSRNTSTRAVTAAASSSAAAAMDRRMCAVSSHPGAVSAAKVCPMPVSDAPTAASPSKMAAESAVPRLGGDEAGHHGECPGEHRDRLEQSDGIRPEVVHDPHDRLGVRGDRAERDDPGKGSETGIADTSQHQPRAGGVQRE